MGGMDSIRVIVADDHSVVREGTRRILEQYSDLEVVGEGADGNEALELIRRLRPDVAILDIRMPGMSGIEVVRGMRELSVQTKAVMLSAYDDDEYIMALMEAGATGYILKTARASELVDAVRRVHQGEPVLHPSIAVKVARLWERSRAEKTMAPSQQLTAREREVLELAAKGLRNKAIADSLVLSVRTVEGHVNSILTKLGVSSRVEAVLYAVSRGWVDLKESDSK